MCRPTSTSTSSKATTSTLVGLSSRLGAAFAASKEDSSDVSAMMTPIRVDTKALELKSGSTTNAAAAATTNASTPETLATTGSSSAVDVQVSTPTRDIFRPEPNWFILQTPGSPQPYRHIVHENEMVTDLMMFGAHHTAPADFAGTSKGKQVIVDVDVYDEDDLINHSELIMPLMDEDRVEDDEDDGAAALKIPTLASSSSSSSRQRLQPKHTLTTAAPHRRQRSHSDLGRMISIPPPTKFRLRPRPLSPRTSMASSYSSYDSSDALVSIEQTLTWPSSPHDDVTTACNRGSSSSIEGLSQMAGNVHLI
mmetsp:Transcript_34797/g.84105  ORF Transcript_34797/g.84105 Transcript_34797/m.84105 type:complete len:309 (-) Transcript_34797:2296-3222(-)|eukprot:CAMPEP_0113471144 /NCGR_PEP_ID=MMETSP0014_2-20120614/16826_1 /TAXON_ID=2857 /ORGANISM="Nitzschia sp." /LENGTH=308 /DNA_ID=CAMNT_0000363769 /DNA_START=739 /DNA_END=1665 /DNA_ORIENTATION=+ /assembly_acc=CAM_ASM_000159